MTEILSSLIISWAIASALMFVLWSIQLKTHNAGYIDVGWVLGIALSTLVCNFFYVGYPARKFLVMVMALTWASRLIYHLMIRLTQDTHEDRRYQHLRQSWKPLLQLKFFALYQFQALLAVILAGVFIAPLHNASTVIGPLEYVAIGLWLIGFFGESIADAQLKVFKAIPANKGKTCDVGLWYYSRHPNYFFEWVMWVAYFVFGLASPGGGYGILAPVIMLWLLLKVSGVPFAEQMALQTRGEEYRRYQQLTSMFIPRPKRRL